MPELSRQEDRAQWNRHLEFVLACIGYAVGLGNIWRFPYLCYKNGGGAFLIPYFTCLFFLGIPILFLEVMFGQFCGTGPISCWDINPLFKGFGYSMTIAASYMAIYYNVIVAVCFRFLFATMSGSLPWTTCDNEWNSCYCRPDTIKKKFLNTDVWYNQTTRNCSGIIVNEETRKTPSQEYYYDHVLELTDSMLDPGGLQWGMTLCNLLGWFIVFMVLIRGVQSMGKAAYVSALLPYVLLTALIAKGATLEGASKGVDFYMGFEASKITDALVWKTAASQIMFSLSTCFGSIMAMSSYNSFHDNCISDTLIISIINCATSFFGGFAIFTVLGYMSEVTGQPVESVVASGTGLAFVVYPLALSKMPMAQLWSFMFFLMMVVLGLGSQFPNVETVITALQDEYPGLRSPKMNKILRAGICLAGFLLGLPQTTRGGMYVLDMIDVYIEIQLLLVGFVETIAIVQIYGLQRFSEDVMLMLGYSKMNVIIYNWYLKWNLAFISPGLFLWIIIYGCIEFEPLSLAPEYTPLADVLGWLMVVFMIVWTPLYYLGLYCYKGGLKGGIQLLQELNEPTPNWGPAADENRTLARFQQRTVSPENRELPRRLSPGVFVGIPLDTPKPVENPENVNVAVLQTSANEDG